MKEQDPDDQLRNMQQGQSPHNPHNESSGSGSAQQSMSRQPEEELLTTGGPVDKSAIDDGDRGFVNARSGISMEDEEVNQSRHEFPQGMRQQVPGKVSHEGGSSLHREVMDSADLDDAEEDINLDKTEGIVNPRYSARSRSRQNDAPGEGESSPGKDVNPI
jgi:hypothetical protein